MCCELKKEELDPELKEILQDLLLNDGLSPKDDDQLIEWINRSPYRTILNRPVHEFLTTKTDTNTDDRSDITKIEVR